MRLFGTSGIRFVADSWLVEQALKIGMAVGGKYLNTIVASDTRTSSPAMKNALFAGLGISGARVYDAGVAPTPTLALAASRFDAGLVITASHNLPEYNGIKILNSDGSAFGPDQQQEIEDLILHNDFRSASWQEFTRPEPYPDAIREHVRKITAVLTGKYPIRVVIDCGGGAASSITPVLLEELGCEVIRLNCRPSGDFPRPSEPVEANLHGLISEVKKEKADLGLAHDGDADRVMAVDDKGRFVSGDKLLIILADSLKAKNIVTTLDTSMIVDELAFYVARTPVGDNHVSWQLKKGGDFGGEPSGAWIFPGISLCPDGIFAAARLVSVAANTKLSELVDGLPSYCIIRNSLNFDRKLMPGLIEELEKSRPCFINKRDGIKLTFDDGSVLVRPSGTEPKIRITAEGRSNSRAKMLYDLAMKAVTAVSTWKQAR